MSRSRRLSWSIPLALVLSVVLAGTALAAIAFSAQTKVGPIYTWNYGNSLESTTTKLHALFATDCVPPSNTCSTYATDAGPYQGVYVMRSGIVSPPVWSAPLRLSQSTLQSERPTLASAGTNVYAGWVTQTSYDAYDPAAKRVFYVRTSTNEGSSYNPAVRVSPLTGRVDYPILAAVEGHVYAIWTDANTGKIQFASGNATGTTWTTKTLGTTTSDAGAGEGFYGYPTITASGTNIAVGWFADNSGKKVGRVSNDSGATFKTPVTLTATSINDTIRFMEGGGADDGVSTRVALIYETPTGVDVREYAGGANLGAASNVITFPQVVGVKTYTSTYGPAVQPYGTDGLAMAFPGCVSTAQTPDDCDYNLNKVRTDMLYREKVGGVLGAIKVLANSAGANSVQTINDGASIVVAGSGAGMKRFVEYNGWNANYANYELYMKVGTGTGP